MLFFNVSILAPLPQSYEPLTEKSKSIFRPLFSNNFVRVAEKLPLNLFVVSLVDLLNPDHFASCQEEELFKSVCLVCPYDNAPLKRAVIFPRRMFPPPRYEMEYPDFLFSDAEVSRRSFQVSDGKKEYIEPPEDLSPDELTRTV